MSSVGPETLPIGGPGGSGEQPSAAPLTAPAAPAPADTPASDPKTGGAGFSSDVATLAREIDASVRLPTLLFFASSVSWLLLGSALASIASFKLNVPGFLAGVSWLTFGRVHPAATNAMLYGWQFPLAMGLGLWVLARLGRVPLRHGGILTAAWALWNVGVTLGICSILYGHGSSYEGLEFPRYVSPILFTAFVFIAIWALLLFRERQGEQAYISQWYALAAFLWFPWVYGTANLVVFFLNTQAAVQAVVAAWYTHNVMGTFLVPLALSGAYYMVPKATGEPIHRYRWAKVGFWTWFLFAGWSGAYSLIGGPVPAWILSVSIAATVLSLIPMTAIVTNLHGSTRQRPEAVRHSPSFRFVSVAIICFLATVLFMALTAFRSVSAVTHFTLLTAAGAQLLSYGFVGFVFFGAFYYMVPRILSAEWESPSLIRAHFWLAVVGLGLGVVSFALGGIVQGFGLDDPKEPALAILSFVKPFLAAQWVAVLLLTAGHVCLAASFILVLLRVLWTNPTVQHTALLLPRPFSRTPSSNVAAPATAAASVP